ncbi:UDP-N-acetylmuramoylalanine--D-glutamate ligase [Bacteroidia bacterium]|nr:UDP-N-acetylmuramoylalanine--D-glutamate ligase [Bacteroidia bacterium]
MNNCKHVLILGFGREGRSTYRHLRKRYPQMHITIADQNTALRDDPAVLNDDLLQFHLGDNYLQALEPYDRIIKTPGISLAHHPLLLKDPRITSQADLFLAEFGSQTIGITGTKGKSTTSSLIYHILKKQSDNVLLVGNIGLPPFDFYDQINKDTKIVFELSSHQLEFVHHAPHIAVLLNIFQEHLDHYTSYGAYQQAKWNITRFQNENDYLVMNVDQPLLQGLWNSAQLQRHRVPVSISQRLESGYSLHNDWIYRDGKAYYDCTSERLLQGTHNLINIMMSMGVCDVLNVDQPTMFSAIADFEPLPHRMQYIGDYAGIQFYNDSISTIPEATIAALRSIKTVQTLILGGFDRGIDYTSLIDFLIMNPIENIIFVGESGKRIRNLWIDEIINNPQIQNDFVQFFDATDYTQVVDIAYHVTTAGHACLLSPAAASYDSFKNFEHRGQTFIELVQSKGNQR